MRCRRVRNPVEKLQSFVQARIVGLWEDGWTYRRIASHVRDSVSVVCRCFQQWSVEHSHTRRPGSGRLRSTDTRQDGHIVWAAVCARTASREEIRAHVAPEMSPRTIGNRLLAAGLRSRVPLARLPLGYPGVGKESTGEWNEAMLSSVMRVDYVCRQVMDVDVYGVDLVGTIFWNIFVHDAQAPPQASWCGGHKLQNSRSHMAFLLGKVSSDRYFTHVVKSVLLPCLRHEGDVLFQQDNAHPHTAAAMQLALRGVQQLPWPARSSNLSPMEDIWDMMKRELNLSPEPSTTITKLRQRVQEAWDNPSQDDIRHLYDCMRKYTPVLTLDGGILFINVKVWAPLTVTCV